MTIRAISPHSMSGTRRTRPMTSSVTSSSTRPWPRTGRSEGGAPLEADESAEEEELSHRPTVGDDVGEDDQGKVAVTPPHDTHEQAEGPMGHEQTWDVDQRLSCAV